MKRFFRRLWIVLSGRRYESAGADSCRKRILAHCDEIARYRRMTSDRFECQSYRESAIHSIKYHAKLLLKELG